MQMKFLSWMQKCWKLRDKIEKNVVETQGKNVRRRILF